MLINVMSWIECVAEDESLRFLHNTTFKIQLSSSQNNLFTYNWAANAMPMPRRENMSDPYQDINSYAQKK